MDIVWSDLGAGLLKAVLEYVKDNFGENAARQTLNKISEKVELLRCFPGIGVKDFDLTDSTEFGACIEVRHLVLPPNIVYYLIDGDEIVIIAVLHAHQSRETIRDIVTDVLDKYKSTTAAK